MSGIIEKLGITPGPWENGFFTKHKTGERVHTVYGRDGDKGLPVCDFELLADNLQNVKLVAAAPEMLEALIESVLMIEALPYFIEIDSKEYAHRNHSIQIIQKATGKSWDEIKELVK